jgi:RHS repeat-associated protein
LNRLTSAQGGGQSWSYAYDANGNRTSETFNGATTSYTYNAANQLTAVGATTFAYDFNGNLVSSSAGLGYGYNPRDQTISIRPSLNAVRQKEEYAGTNQWERTASIRSAKYTRFHNDKLGVAVRTHDQEGTTSYTRDQDGTLVSQRAPAGRFYYLFDGLGSVVALTDSAGNVAATYKYDPFGKDIGSTGTVVNPWRFHGEYYSAEVGLYKMGLRWYDPAVGRWTQRDVIEQPLQEAGWNSYIFAGDNPVNFTDPTGAYVKQCIAGALFGGGVAAFFGGAGVVPSAIGGCAGAVTIEIVRRHVDRDAAEALEFLDRGHATKKILKGAARRIFKHAKKRLRRRR